MFFYSCSNDPQLITEFITKEDLPIEQMENVEILHTEKGVLQIKIIANNINSQTDLLQKINSEISKNLDLQKQMQYDIENNSFSLKKKEFVFRLDNLEKEKTNFENNLKEENKKLYNKIYEELENSITDKKDKEIQKIKLEYNNVIPTISKLEEDFEKNKIKIKSMKKDFAKLDNNIQEISETDEKEMP